MTLLDGTSEQNQEHDVNTDNNIPRIGSLWNRILIHNSGVEIKHI